MKNPLFESDPSDTDERRRSRRAERLSARWHRARMDGGSRFRTCDACARSCCRRTFEEAGIASRAIFPTSPRAACNREGGGDPARTRRRRRRDGSRSAAARDGPVGGTRGFSRARLDPHSRATRPKRAGVLAECFSLVAKDRRFARARAARRRRRRAMGGRAGGAGVEARAARVERITRSGSRARARTLTRKRRATPSEDVHPAAAAAAAHRTIAPETSRRPHRALLAAAGGGSHFRDFFFRRPPLSASAASCRWRRPPLPPPPIREAPPLLARRRGLLPDARRRRTAASASRTDAPPGTPWRCFGRPLASSASEGSAAAALSLSSPGLCNTPFELAPP